MKLKPILSPDIITKVTTMLVEHFNYSISDIDSWDELTPTEKVIIPRELFESITDSELEVFVKVPQHYIEMFKSEGVSGIDITEDTLMHEFEPENGWYDNHFCAVFYNPKTNKIMKLIRSKLGSRGNHLLEVLDGNIKDARRIIKLLKSTELEY